MRCFIQEGKGERLQDKTLCSISAVPWKCFAIRVSK